MYSFNDLKKNAKKSLPGNRVIKLAIIADSASQLLHLAIKGYGVEKNIAFEIYEADYNQIDLQVFDKESGLYSFRPEFIFINYSTEHVIKEFYAGKFSARDAFAKRRTDDLNNICTTLLENLQTKIIINSLGEVNDGVFGNYASKVEGSLIYQVRKANLLLMDLSRQIKELFICDINVLQGQLGYAFSFDPKMYVNADMCYSIDFLPYIAKYITDIIEAITGNFKKCLVIDLDNTMWGGIIGDDGMEGIQLGDLGIGKAYTDLQLWFKELQGRGIILAVCSKNDESIAKEPFLNHPDMILRLEDIAVFVANWENKVDNIYHIRDLLNINMDSIVFLDDNPFEREIVRQSIPELTIPSLPEDPAEYLTYLRTLNLFETASFSGEDKDRTRQYQEESLRIIVQKRFADEASFLESLEMKSVVSPFNDFILPRVAQLTQRSNQFNLRTIRYTEGELKRMINSPDYFTLSFTLEDKYGDLGLICVIILKKENEESLFIDTWIMSCRVLKRGMEKFTLNALKDLAIKEKCNPYAKLPARQISIYDNCRFC